MASKYPTSTKRKENAVKVEIEVSESEIERLRVVNKSDNNGIAFFHEDETNLAITTLLNRRILAAIEKQGKEKP
jgi:hypothetical protein